MRNCFLEQMANKVLEGIMMDAHLNQEQRHQFSKQLSSVVWMIKLDQSTTKEDVDHPHVAGVCISPMGYILSSSHVIKPGVKYVGLCPSWRAGWTSLKVVKRSMSYGLSLLKVEASSKKTDHTDLANNGVLEVNQQLYGFGHPDICETPCVHTFVRGSVEYQCGDCMELPACVNDLELPSAQSPEDLIKGTYDSEFGFDRMKILDASPRMVKHFKRAIDVKTFIPKSIRAMHQDIPLIQIKNFHLGFCGGPAFVSSGHLIGVNIFKLKDINFAVHLSAIKEFLKGVELV